MTRLISLDHLPTRARRISQISIGLAVVALALIAAEWVLYPASNSMGTAFAQVVLAVVCLAVGAIYLFGDQSNLDDGSAVIDLRQDDSATDAAPPAPRQLPDARANRSFAT